MNRSLDVSTSFAASLARIGGGLRVGRLGPRPERPIELWDFEACPYCRKVREALSVLDLQARIYPCPHGGKRFRPAVKERGGKTQFPYLVDPNTGMEMYESEDIVRYLHGRYGEGPLPLAFRGGPLWTASSAVATLTRPGRGGRVRPTRAPERPLELYSFEASPYCRIVREALCSLELPYLLHNVAKGSPSRGAFVERSGKMKVPYLIDPNTGVAMFESADIVAYLQDTYAL
ncbi:MAG: glutathione S-transferase N-terminal domain-containing protein [Myxococcota bacterium]